MKGVSLCAGLATRLRPLTAALPKAAIPVMGVPSLYLAMLHLRAAGIEEIAINAHHQSEIVRSLVESWPFPSPKVYISFEDPIQGTAGCYPLLGSWRKQNPLLVYNPDIVCDFELSQLMDFFYETQPYAVLVFTQTPPGHRPSVHIGEGDQVLSVGPTAPEGTVTSGYGTGIFCLSDNLLSEIKPGPSDLRAQLNAGIAAGKTILALEHSGQWIDCGDSPQRLFEAHVQLAHSWKKNGLLVQMISNLWTALGKTVEFVDTKSKGSQEIPKFIEQTVQVGNNANLGSASFLFGETHVGDGANVQNILSFGKTEIKPGSKLYNAVVHGSHRIDLA